MEGNDRAPTSNELPPVVTLEMPLLPGALTMSIRINVQTESLLKLAARLRGMNELEDPMGVITAIGEAITSGRQFVVFGPPPPPQRPLVQVAQPGAVPPSTPLRRLR